MVESWRDATGNKLTKRIQFWLPLQNFFKWIHQWLQQDSMTSGVWAALSTKCWQAVYLGNLILCLWLVCWWWLESQMDVQHFHTRPHQSWKVFSAAALKSSLASGLMFMSWSIIHSYKESSLHTAPVRIADQSIKKLWRKQSTLLRYHRSLKKLY